MAEVLGDTLPVYLTFRILLNADELLNVYKGVNPEQILYFGRNVNPETLQPRIFFVVQVGDSLFNALKYCVDVEHIVEAVDSEPDLGRYLKGSMPSNRTLKNRLAELWTALLGILYLR